MERLRSCEAACELLEKYNMSYQMNTNWMDELDSKLKSLEELEAARAKEAWEKHVVSEGQLFSLISPVRNVFFSAAYTKYSHEHFQEYSKHICKEIDISACGSCLFCSRPFKLFSLYSNCSFS